MVVLHFVRSVVAGTMSYGSFWPRASVSVTGTVKESYWKLMYWGGGAVLVIFMRPDPSDKSAACGHSKR